MPVIEGNDAIDRNEFKEHCQIVLEATSVSQSQRYAALKPQNSGFWEVDWHIKCRKQEWRRMIDIVSINAKDKPCWLLKNFPLKKQQGCEST